jgi:hypothetical protein
MFDGFCQTLSDLVSRRVCPQELPSTIVGKAWGSLRKAMFHVKHFPDSFGRNVVDGISQNVSRETFASLTLCE